MRRCFALFVTMAILLSVIGCGKAKEEASSPDQKESAQAGSRETSQKETEKQTDHSEKPIRVLMVIGGHLGDGQSTDTVYAAVKEVVEAKGGELIAAECSDASLFESYMMDGAASGENDLIIAPFAALQEATELAAKEYPDQKFIGYDVEYSYDGKNANVVSFRGRSCEGGFMEGVTAALLTTSGAEGTNPEKVVGFVGGGENPAIQDFLFGFIDGVKYIDTEIDVKYSFVGNWDDIAIGKELGITQIEAGADVIYTTCGTASYGTAAALVESGGYCLGCGGDFAALTAESQPDISRIFISSDMNSYDKIIAGAVEDYMNGTLEFGKHYEVG
ncbi:MAG: BMP family ABC transporter substrate-binding protein [Lachnospiraceae bacterium]|nr:BMP family ABC transporter substrate-binding protein [Lachnospiraceae bacterium]